MKPVIPEFSLTEAVKLLKPEKDLEKGYYAASFAPPAQMHTFPHRTSYIGIGICLKGQINLSADLETYLVKPGTLVIMAPEVIRTWQDQTTDYTEETLCFTEAFYLETGMPSSAFKELIFFQNEIPRMIGLTNREINLILGLMQDLKRTMTAAGPRADAIVRSYIHILLNQIADLYDKYIPVRQTRPDAGARLVSEFKKLLMKHRTPIHSVNEYAGLLNVSPKHLSQTLSEHTGKTAGQWIHDMFILEAKVKLNQTSLTISQISDSLNFSDPSLFGKYFKRYSGYTPATYRKLSSNKK